MPRAANALTKTWTNTGTDFNTSGNWSGGIPGASDTAEFNVAEVKNPNLSASLTIQNIDFSAATAAGYDLTSSNTSIKITLTSTTTGTGAAIHSVTSSGANTIDLPIVLGAASGQTQTFNQSNGGTLIVNGVVSSTNTVGLSLRGIGGGTIQLNGANTYSGGTSIDVNGEIVVLGNNSALGAGSLTNNGTGATIQASGGARSISNAISLAATTTISGSNDLTLSGVVSGASALTKTGTAVLTLSGINTLSGGININAGTVTLGSSSAMGSSGTISYGGGTLQYSASNTTDYSSRFSTATNQTYSIDTNGQNVTFASALASVGGSLTKIGMGTLTLTGTNVYTGGTNINAGTINVGSASALGASGTISFGGGTLQYSASNSTDYSGRFSTAANQAYSIDTNSQNVTFATALTSSGGSLTKSGLGTLILSAANTYTGGTTVSAGTLQLSGSGTLGSTSNALTVNGGTVDLNGTNQTVGALSGSGGTILNNSTATAKTLTVGQGGGTGSYAGVISDHSSGTGTLALTKTGTGTQTLTGTNTFTGATTINGGTLTLAGTSGSALGSTGSITVNSGGTLLLGASDQINNAATMTLAGGTFAKAGFGEGGTASVGVGALTLTADSHIDFSTSAVGTLTFASLTTNAHMVTVDNWTGTYNHVGSVSSDRLIFDTDQSANLNSFFFTGYGQGGVEFALGNGFFEVVAAVPEPKTWVPSLLMAITIAGQRVQRRLRKRTGRR